jgi:hypothetical protein
MGWEESQRPVFCVDEPKKMGARSARRVVRPKPTSFLYDANYCYCSKEYYTYSIYLYVQNPCLELFL